MYNAMIAIHGFDKNVNQNPQSLLTRANIKENCKVVKVAAVAHASN